MKRILQNLIGRKTCKQIRSSYQLNFESLEERLVMDAGGLDTLGLTASTAAVMDNAGNMVADMQPDTERAMASTTKVMTVMVTIERALSGEFSLSDTVQVGSYARTAGGSGFNDFQTGQQFVLEDLLYVVMLPSDNSAAQTVAEYVALNTNIGRDYIVDATAEYNEANSTQIDADDILNASASYDQASGVILNSAFVRFMNLRAQQLGLTNTNYVNPHGRDPNKHPEQGTDEGTNDGHYSSAHDLAELTRVAMQYGKFADIAGAVNKTVSSTLPNGATKNYSMNTFVGVLSGPNAYPGVTGGKGGTTGAAGRVLISQATILGRTLNAAVMNSGSGSARDLDTHKVFNFGFEQEFGFIVDVAGNSVTTRTSGYDFASRSLTVIGTEGSDIISIYRYANDMWISVNGVAEFLPIADIGSFTIDAKGGSDTITISGVPAEFGSMVVNTGAGSDTVKLGTGVGLGIFDAPVTVNGQSGDVVRVTDYGSSGGQQFTIGSDYVKRNGETVLNYYGISTLKVTGTNNADTFTIQSLSGTEVEIDGGWGADELVGPYKINEWKITAGNKGKLDDFLSSTGEVSFNDIENLTGGNSYDYFKFQGGIISGNINGAGGNDVLDFSSLSEAVTVNLQSMTADHISGQFSGIERIWGTSNLDTLIGADAGALWTITNDNEGTVATAGRSFGFKGFENLIGGSEDDTFKFADGAGVSGLIDGKLGTDTLDYSEYTTAVAVDLATRQATGVGGGVWNFENVITNKDKAADVQDDHGFKSTGDFHQNLLGWNEKWFKDSEGQWHFITPDGRIYRYISASELAANEEIAEVDESIYTDLSLLFDPNANAATATAPALQETYGFRSAGEFHQNWVGWNEKWFKDAQGAWYFITASGRLYRYVAGADLSASEMIAQVDAGTYGDLSLLFDPNQSAPFRSALELQEQYGFVSAGDAYQNWGGWNEKWFKDRDGNWFFVTSSGRLYQYVAGADLSASTLIAQVGDAIYEDLSWLFDPRTGRLPRRYPGWERAFGFHSNGNYLQNWAGWDEKWFQDKDNNWYFITTSGRIYQWDGGSDLATGTEIADVSAAAYGDPTSLFNS